MPGIVQTPPTPALPHKGGGSFERAWPSILFPLRGRTVAYELYVVIPGARRARNPEGRSEEHTSELQSLMRISYAVFCLKKKKKDINIIETESIINHQKK